MGGRHVQLYDSMNSRADSDAAPLLSEDVTFTEPETFNDRTQSLTLPSPTTRDTNLLQPPDFRQRGSPARSRRSSMTGSERSFHERIPSPAS